MLSVSGGLLTAQTTKGTDFWISFIIPDRVLEGDSSLSIIVATDHIDVLTVSAPALLWTQYFTVYPNRLNKLYIPYNVGLPEGIVPIKRTGIHVKSQHPVSLFASVQSNASNDITCVLPTEALKDDYIIQTYPGDHRGSVFGIVATSDNTIADISFQPNDGSPPHIQTVTLTNEGHIYYFASSDTCDYSGTRIQAYDNKKIAVFCGNPRAFIPNHPITQSGDILYGQCIPTADWGREFIVIPCGRTIYYDRIRITALNDSCRVTINDTLRCTLASRQTYEYPMYSDFDFCHIVTTQPVIVGHYFASTYDQMSDPSLVYVPPLDKGIDTMLFACPNSEMTQKHKAIILAHRNSLPDLRLDNARIDTFFHPIYNNSIYRYARIEVDSGSHTLSTLPNDMFHAYIYGIGHHESYGYTVYPASTRTNTVLFVNGNNSTRLPEDVSLCHNDTILFELYLNYTADSIFWYLDNILALRDEESFVATPSLGSHRLTVRIYHHSTPAHYFDSEDTVINFSFIIDTAVIFFKNDTITSNNIPHSHGGNIYYCNTENDTIIHPSLMGCDSVEIYSLFIIPVADSSKEVQLWIPNVFTPGKENNGQFHINTTGLAKAEISIFNRQGLRIAQYDAKSLTWDGTSNGIACPTGTYVYLLRYSTLHTPMEEHTVVGTVLLLR